MEIKFPGNYPSDYCRVKLTANQEMSSGATECGNEAIQNYWQSSMLDGLMLRPFLRWWDNNLVRILQSPFLESEEIESSSEENESTDGSEENKSTDDGEEEETVCVSRVVTKSKRGTEIRFLGLDISQTMGTAFWMSIKVVVSCSRCKNHQEAEIKEERCCC